MPNGATASRLEVTRRSELGGGLCVLSGNGLRIVVNGHDGCGWPEVLHDAELTATDPGGGWRLSCREGLFPFRARGLEIQQALPGLFDEWLAPHRLRTGGRLAARVLLQLLRLPGGARLLRTWHAQRR